MKNCQKNIRPNLEFQNRTFDVKKRYLVPIWTSKHVKKNNDIWPQFEYIKMLKSDIQPNFEYQNRILNVKGDI